MDIKEISNYSISDLRGICQVTAPGPSSESYAGRFCRFFSIYITKMFLYTKITPNQITTMSVLVFFVGIAMFFVGTYDYNIFAVILILLSIVLDGSDGEVARFRNNIEKNTNGSKIGGVYTEPVSHDIQYGFSFFLMGLAFYLNTGIAVYLMLGGLASILKLEYRLIKFRFATTLNYLRGFDDHLGVVKGGGEKNLLASLFSCINRNFLSSTGFLLIVSFFSFINRVEWSLWFYAFSYGLFWMAVFIRQIFVIIKNRY